MLAGCSSSTLLSPRHRLRTEAAAQLQACHFQLPSMSTQRLDLPCSFPRKDSSRSQPIRPVGLSVEKTSIDSKTSTCSLKQSIRLPPLATSRPAATIQAEVKDQFWEKRGKGLKRFAEVEDEEDEDESIRNRVKRKRCSSENDLSLGELGGGSFWFQPGFHVPRSVQAITGIDPPQFPYTFPNNPWLQSVVTEITDLKDGETSHAPVGEPSGDSSTSSGSQSLGLRVNESVSEPEGVVGSGHGHNPYGDAGVEAEDEEESEVEQQGFELLSLLNACIEAIGMKNIAAINHFIAKLGELASPKGSAISRLTAYYTEALALRVTRLWPHVFQISPPREFDRGDDESGTAMRLLNQVSPIPKFLHFTSNEILLRAFEGKDRVHIIDFDIKLGLQWPSLFQSLASRTNPPSHVRITGVGESKQELNETGDRLAGFAGALNLPFEFHPVVDRLEDVRLWMLHVKEQESVAVNCAFQLHKTLYDTTGGAFRDFLGLIRSTNPTIVLMAEQEAEHNEPRLEARVSNSLRYYSAIFDLIGSSLPLDSPARIKVEDTVAREIRNIVACEGSDRLERHEGFEKWRMLMEQGGFRCNGITDREFLQSQFLLKMYECENYSVKKQGQRHEGPAALTLSWMDQPLYTVSAWTPVDVAGGSSSSFSQPS
ncbi:PREDICTED: scarecrow-like protein 28 [Fragaria vesca subsp. vesca]|uniref:scarecrow-like protein 28 n=1 Tax=Fragaria vesca subsp. vesca TaxID=101020 RepID=UPI0002C3291F|nr:PREDICTED: scarecrow-like protein 28 [Fragaria vesca subsp. vesca]